MKKLGTFVGVSAVCALLLSACGGESVDSCNGSNTMGGHLYSITGYDTSLVFYDKPIGVSLQAPKPLTNNESPAWNTFSLELKAVSQSYQVGVLPVIHFSLFPQAMACSPAPSVVMQKLTKISITSANDFSDKYPAGNELVSLFGSIDHVSTLTNLLVNSAAPLSLRLKLLEAPQFARQNFNVQITLDDGRVFLLRTGDVYFALP